MKSLHSRRGFTVVELLVVIAIASVLAALLLPVLQGALVQGQLTGCRNNLRQMHLITACYGADAREALPPTPAIWVHGTNSMIGYDDIFSRVRPSAMGLAAAYIGGDNGVFYCPSRRIDISTSNRAAYTEGGNRAAWATLHATGSYAGYILSHYSAGWYYNPEWLPVSLTAHARAAAAAGYYLNTQPATFKTRRPSLELYGQSRRVLFVDTNELFDEPFTGNFHDNAAYQNFVRFEGSCGTITAYWDSAVYAAGTYYATTRLPDPYARWWQIFGNR